MGGGYKNNKAEMAGLISYARPTDEMLAEAQRAGMYQLDAGNLFGVMEYPRIQILTAEEILEGKKFNIPSNLVKKKHEM